MSEDDAKSFADKAMEDFEEGMTVLWRNAIADTVLELLESDGTVTKKSLRDEIVARIADESRSRIEKATFRGALKALDGQPLP